MGPLTAGAVVLVPFPFLDLSQSKLRPAVVIADAGRGDWVLCQITSTPYGDPRSISITNDDFSRGSLRVPSVARPGKLFPANTDLIVSEIGQLKAESLRRIITAIIDMLRASSESVTGTSPANPD